MAMRKRWFESYSFKTGQEEGLISGIGSFRTALVEWSDGAPKHQTGSGFQSTQTEGDWLCGLPRDMSVAVEDMCVYRKCVRRYYKGVQQLAEWVFRDKLLHLSLLKVFPPTIRCREKTRSAGCAFYFPTRMGWSPGNTRIVWLVDRDNGFEVWRWKLAVPDGETIIRDGRPLQGWSCYYKWSAELCKEKMSGKVGRFVRSKTPMPPDEPYECPIPF
jgi:hypothetical protein